MRARGVQIAIWAVRVLAGLLSAPAAAADLPASPAMPPPVAVPPAFPLWSRFYLSLHGGVGLLQDTSIDYVNGALPSRSMSFDTGWTITGAAGIQATPWWRSEIELGERRNGVGSISPGAGPSGSASATTLMLNGYLDIPNASAITPYLGAGFGKAWITQSLTVDGAPLTSGGNTSWPWAYQLMAGANVAISSRLSAELEYRFVGSQRGLFQDAQGLFYNADYNNHSFLIGLRYRPL